MVKAEDETLDGGGSLFLGGTCLAGAEKWGMNMEKEDELG